MEELLGMMRSVGLRLSFGGAKEFTELLFSSLCLAEIATLLLINSVKVTSERAIELFAQF